MNKFLNPYDKKNLTEHETLCRTTIEVFRSRHAYIMGTYGKSGALQTTINILIEKLYDELTKHGIGPSFDVDRYALAIADCTLIIGGVQRSPVAIPATGTEHPVTVETSKGNDGRGTSAVAQSSENAQQPANTKSAPSSKRVKKSSKKAPVTLKGKAKSTVKG